MSIDGRILANVGVLAAIVESGSFARAADALGLSPSGVSRAVGRLEARVGVRLLDRTTRSVTLTDEGRRLYEDIGPLLAGIGDAVTLAAGSAAAVRGRLRVNVDAYFRGGCWRRISPFLARHPDLSLELAAREQLGDLVAEGFDVAVRFGEPPSSSLVARKLLETRAVTVAAPAYVKRHGRPEAPAELVGHACIQMRNTLTGQPLEWVYQLGRKRVPVNDGQAARQRRRHDARCMPRRRRHCTLQGERGGGADRTGAARRAACGLARRGIPAVRVLPVAPLAARESAGVRRFVAEIVAAGS